VVGGCGQRSLRVRQVMTRLSCFRLVSRRGPRMQRASRRSQRERRVVAASENGRPHRPGACCRPRQPSKAKVTRQRCLRRATRLGALCPGRKRCHQGRSKSRAPTTSYCRRHRSLDCLPGQEGVCAIARSRTSPLLDSLQCNSGLICLEVRSLGRATRNLGSFSSSSSSSSSSSCCCCIGSSGGGSSSSNTIGV
jgi:hypothetical protein